MLKSIAELINNILSDIEQKPELTCKYEKCTDCDCYIPSQRRCNFKKRRINYIMDKLKTESSNIRELPWGNLFCDYIVNRAVPVNDNTNIEPISEDQTIDNLIPHWTIELRGDGWNEWTNITCSHCGSTYEHIEDINKYKVCPNCGEVMNKGINKVMTNIEFKSLKQLSKDIPVNKICVDYTNNGSVEFVTPIDSSISLELIDKTIKHYESLQKRYTKQHNGKHCDYVKTALVALNILKEGM
jgi:hypothetical protein